MTPVAYFGQDLVAWSDGTFTVSPCPQTGHHGYCQPIPRAPLQAPYDADELRQLGYKNVRRIIALDPRWN